MNIVMQRTGALGDVILTTPILRRLRRENPDACISIYTAYPDVFRNNPHVGGTPVADEPPRIVNLDLAYERRPHIHIVEAYMLEAFGDAGDPQDRLPEVFPRATIALPPRTIAVHAAMAGWRNRTLPRQMWHDLIEWLVMAMDYRVILVGTVKDAVSDATLHIGGWKAVSPVTQFHINDLFAQAAVIKSCAAFIGSDSGLLHLATAVGTPAVGLFTSVDPALRMPLNASNCRAVAADIPCAGCHHLQPAPATTESCTNTGNPLGCLGAIALGDVIRAVTDIVK